MNFNSEYSVSLRQGLDHLHAFASMEIDDAVDNIKKGTGSFTGSLSVLVMRAYCNAMLAFFQKEDLVSMRQWCFTAAMIDKTLLKRGWYDNYPVGDLVWAVLSGNEPMVNWFSQADDYLKDASKSQLDDPRRYPYFAYQARLAIRGDWVEFAQRSEMVISNPDVIKNQKFLLCDYRFFAALARGDREAMKGEIIQMIASDMRKRSFSTRNALVAGVMEPHATLYAKIAHRHGYPIEIDSPWVPMQLVRDVVPMDYEDMWGIFPFLD